MESKVDVTLPLPIVISKEGEWFVASCPLLDIATQGKDEKEVKENMRDLIEEYFEDSDTPKPNIKEIMSSSVSISNVPVKMEMLHGEA